MVRGVPVRRALLALAIFNALSAIGGGVWLLMTGGPGLPAGASGPFGSFVIPGLLLAVVIGGTQAVAAVALWFRGPVAAAATAVAGLGMMLWVFVEVCLILAFSPLHALYFATGFAQVALLLLSLGVLRRPPGSLRPR